MHVLKLFYNYLLKFLSPSPPPIYNILCPWLILILSHPYCSMITHPPIFNSPSCLTKKDNTTRCRYDPGTATTVSDLICTCPPGCRQARLASSAVIQLMQGYSERVPQAVFKGAYLHLGYQTFGSGPSVSNPMSNGQCRDKS